MIYYTTQVKALKVRLSWVTKKGCIPMFNLGDKVVYPGYGVAQINRIIQKPVNGIMTTFYELKFLTKEMIVLVPTNGPSMIRSLSSLESINVVFKILSQPSKNIKHIDIVSNWKQRNKNYQLKLRTGCIKKISEIYKELKNMELHKELSFCEKNILQQTESLLAEEIALVHKQDAEKAIKQLRSFFTLNQNKTTQKTF